MPIRVFLKTNFFKILRSILICAALTEYTWVHAGSPDGAMGAQLRNLAPEEMTDQIVVRYVKSAVGEPVDQAETRTRFLNAASVYGVRASIKRVTGGGSTIWKLERPVALSKAQEIARQLQAADRGIEFAHADTLLQAAMVPSDPYYGAMWSYADTAAGISLPLAWDIATGAGVRVAVIDSGHRPHADLAGKVIGGYDFIADVARANDGDGREGNAQDPGDWGSCAAQSGWHGTHVAGNIGALANNNIGSLGVAFNSSIISARVLGVCGGYNSDIADAIRWASGNAVSGVPANANPARVLNLSLSGSGGCSGEMSSAINAARSQGALVVVAAGNNASDAASFQPANCPGVLTVAATDAFGGRASFSNFGTVVGIAAPGVSIWSTLNAGSTGPAADSYAAYSGTSMAAPHVAGVAALVSSVNPSLTGDEIAVILKSTTKPFPSSCIGCGSGIVHAKAAVDEAVRTRTRITASPSALSIDGNGGVNFSANITVRNTGIVTLGPVSVAVSRLSGTVEHLSASAYTCAGSALTPGATCQIQLQMTAGCGWVPTASTWNLNISAVGSSSVIVVPVIGNSAEGVCY